MAVIVRATSAAMPGRQARFYIGTKNNPDISPEDVIIRLVEHECQYTFQKERGEAGTEHYQFFVAFPRRRTVRVASNILQNVFGPCHVEVARDVRASERYCRKIDSRVDGPWSNVNNPNTLGQGARTDLAAIAERISEGASLRTVALEFPTEFMRYPSGVARYHALYSEPAGEEEVRGIWIFGEPGIGKSHYVREKYGDSLFVKSMNKWWDGYDGEETVLLDDYDLGGKCLGHYIKIWADKWPCRGEVKGATTALRYKRFVCTSNYSIDAIWPDDAVLLRAIRRRFVIHHVMNREGFALID